MLIIMDQGLCEVHGEQVLPADWLACGEAVCAAEGSHLKAAATRNGTLVLMDDYVREIRTGIDEPIESLLILDELAPAVLLGTEGAHLYRADELAVRRLSAFDALACRSQWHTPWGGPPAVRSLAAAGGWTYADIHVGSIMRSNDGGKSWQPVAQSIDQDVHQVATCASAPRRIYANTASGFFLSEDCGSSWEHRAGGLGNRYGRAVAVSPVESDRVLATVSDGPHGDNVSGQLYLTTDGGRSWRHVCEGFPASTVENINTFCVAFTSDGRAWAAVENTLYLSSDGGERWAAFWRAPAAIIALAACGQSHGQETAASLHDRGAKRLSSAR